jgi:uncharacterized membrane protein YdbT with pleckstrin-like domain
MPERFKEWFLEFLRVPREPTVPAGASTLRIFRAAPNYFRYRLAIWAITQVGVVLGLLAGLVFLYNMQRTISQPVVLFLVRGVEVLAWVTFILQIPFSLAALRLDFDMRWYILADRSLRIREGIFSLHEKTMTFANIQQITIRQNPLQRLLGIADVNVRSAGGGGSSSGGKGKEAHIGEAMHEAYFRGVDNAEEIRAAIRQRVRSHRDAGLGDPDEAPAVNEEGAEHVVVPSTSPALLAARELRGELRTLNQALLTGR